MLPYTSSLLLRTTLILIIALGLVASGVQAKLESALDRIQQQIAAIGGR